MTTSGTIGCFGLDLTRTVLLKKSICIGGWWGRGLKSDPRSHLPSHLSYSTPKPPRRITLPLIKSRYPLIPRLTRCTRWMILQHLRPRLRRSSDGLHRPRPAGRCRVLGPAARGVLQPDPLAPRRLIACAAGTHRRRRRVHHDIGRPLPPARGLATRPRRGQFPVGWRCWPSGCGAGRLARGVDDGVCCDWPGLGPRAGGKESGQRAELDTDGVGPGLRRGWQRGGRVVSGGGGGGGGGHGWRSQSEGKQEWCPA